MCGNVSGTQLGRRLHWGTASSAGVAGKTNEPMIAALLAWPAPAAHCSVTAVRKPFGRSAKGAAMRASPHCWRAQNKRRRASKCSVQTSALCWRRPRGEEWDLFRQKRICTCESTYVSRE